MVTIGSKTIGAHAIIPVGKLTPNVVLSNKHLSNIDLLGFILFITSMLMTKIAYQTRKKSRILSQVLE